jgi:hypothetical protein
MIEHHVIVPTAYVNVNLFAPALIVTRASELAPALTQRERPVVIQNDELERKFSRVERWRDRENTYRFLAALIAGLLALAIAYQYKIDASWHSDWKMDRIDGKIALTPMRQ